MNNEDSIIIDDDVKYRVLISDSWIEVCEEVWEAHHGARCLDASDAGGPITYESGR